MVKSLPEIKNNLPKNMALIHVELYMNNTKRIREYEAANVKKEVTEGLKNTNFGLICFYVFNKNEV